MAAPAPPITQTETIGRLPHLLAHMAAQLRALRAERDTFDEIRACYGQTMKSLAAIGQARVTASRDGIGASLRHWTSARDLIKELQTLGWVQGGIPTPSTKNSVDAHRDRRYPLTDAGRVAAGAAGDRRALADLLTAAVLTHHPYVVALVRALDAGPIFCPEFRDSDLGQKLGTAHYAGEAAARLNSCDPRVRVDAGAVEEHLRVALKRSFAKPARDGREITTTERRAAVNAALADFALQQRGLRFGATTLNNLVDLGRELRLLDDSRYVPGRDGGRLVWLCCDLREADGQLSATRRPYSSRAEAVARAVVDTYGTLRDRAAPDSLGLSGDYQFIHVVRAGAAYATGTAREVAERAIADLSSGGHPQLGVSVRPLAARVEVPPWSEPMYARDGLRALKMTITSANAAL